MKHTLYLTATVTIIIIIGFLVTYFYLLSQKPVAEAPVVVTSTAPLGKVSPSTVSDGQYRVEIDSVLQNPEDTVLTVRTIGSSTTEVSWTVPTVASTTVDLLKGTGATIDTLKTYIEEPDTEAVFVVIVQDGQAVTIEEVAN